MQIKIKVANNVPKVANTLNKVTKKPPQVANKDLGCKYFLKLAKKFLRVANLNLQVQINPSQLQIKLCIKGIGTCQSHHFYNNQSLMFKI